MWESVWKIPSLEIEMRLWGFQFSDAISLQWCFLPVPLLRLVYYIVKKYTKPDYIFHDQFILSLPVLNTFKHICVMGRGGGTSILYLEHVSTRILYGITTRGRWFVIKIFIMMASFRSSYMSIVWKYPVLRILQRTRSEFLSTSMFVQGFPVFSFNLCWPTRWKRNYHHLMPLGMRPTLIFHHENARFFLILAKYNR